MNKKTNSMRTVVLVVVLLIIIGSAFLFWFLNNDDNNKDSQSNDTSVSTQSEQSKQDVESSLPSKTESSESASNTSEDSAELSDDSSEIFNDESSVASDDPDEQSSNTSDNSNEQSSDISDEQNSSSSDTEVHQHSFGNWETINNATCIENGKKQRICNGCGEQQSEKLLAFGHTYDSGTVLEEAKSCAEIGTMLYTCNTCGNQYNVATRGAHKFVRDDLNHLTTCELCTEQFYDEFSKKDQIFVPIDENSAMIKDVIKLEQPIYTGKLSTWSEKWFDYSTVIFRCMMYRSESYYMGAPVGNYPHTDGMTSEEDAEKARAEFILFLDDFEDAFGWRPDAPTIGFYHDPWTDEYCLNFDVDEMYKDYRSQIKKLSKERIEEIEKDIAAYLVHLSGVYNGMSVYNATAEIMYMVHGWAYYDWSLRLHDAIDGFALRSCVCDGFAQMYKRLAEYCGIDAEMVVGKMMGQGHAWIRITFSDGTVRYVDPTHCSWLMHPDNMEDYSW